MTSDRDTVVLIPTWRRAHHIGPFLEALYANHGDIPVRPVFLCDSEDKATLDAVRREGADLDLYVVDGCGSPATMVQKVNGVLPLLTEPFLFGASDDIRILPGCLEAAHEAMDRDGVHIVCVNDGIDNHRHEGELTGHCLVRRSYITEQSGVMDQPGVVMHPGYFHYFSDVEFWQVGKARGCYVSCFDARIDHPHPNNGTAAGDAVRDWGIRHIAADRATYESRRHMWERVNA